MTPSVNDVSALVAEEVNAIRDPVVREGLSRLLVTPEHYMLGWDYGEPGEEYSCWKVAVHAAFDTWLVYSEHGFGPQLPWGMVSSSRLRDHMEDASYIGPDMRDAHRSQMPASAAREVVDWLHQARIRVWLDGGWGVDALLGRETRVHHDVDIIASVSDVPKLLEVCRGRGFTLRKGSPPHAFLLADESGREIDVHTVAFSNDGSAAHRMETGETWIFSAESFTGSGAIEGVRVPCLSAEAQVRCHAQGYTPTEKDLRDMELLQETFGVELPPLLQRVRE